MQKRALTNHLIERATSRLTSARKEHAERAGFDKARRQSAVSILDPNEVSGDYDTKRALLTTLRGNIHRPITLDDLRAFQRNVATLRKLHSEKVPGKRALQYRGGITAQHCIDLAAPPDTQRANDEIRMAVVAAIRGPLVHFITNSGPDSNVARHHVHVQFQDFQGAAGASPNDTKKIGKKIAQGRLKFDCDCGRHTFWYRYMATVGEYAYGRDETGFPKIRNPKLRGVACKHVLRVMHTVLKDANVHQKLGEQVRKVRGTLDVADLKTERTKAADIKKQAAAQAAKRKSQTNLKTSATKADESARRKAKTAMQSKAAAKAAPPPAESPRAKAKRLREDEARLNALLASGVLDRAMFTAGMKNIEAQRNA
jgi:hypothetical protein